MCYFEKVLNVVFDEKGGKIVDDEMLIIGIDYGKENTQMAYYDKEAADGLCIEENISTESAETTIKHCMEIMQSKFPDKNKSETCIVITKKTYVKEEAEELAAYFANDGYKKELIQVITYKQAYMYYVMNGPKECCQNDVGLFDYDMEGLKYYQLVIDRRREPYVVGVVEKDYSDTLKYDQEAFKNDEELPYIFENVAQNATHKQILSSLYMTGKGFESDWADETMKKMCRGRRVFKGGNLYVKGACFAAAKNSHVGKMPEVVFIDDNMIQAYISTKVYYNASDSELIIAKAGTPWDEVDNSIRIIPDMENELQINVTNVVTREKSTHIIPVDFVGKKRLAKMTRLRVRVRFQGVHKCIITISDEGFGKLCPSSRKIYEKIISI